MSIEEENKAIVLNAYELFNKRDLDAFFTFFNPDYIEHYTARDLSLEEIKNTTVNTIPNWSEGNSTIEYLIAEGDKVAYRITHRGTHKSTGKKVQWTNTAIARIAGSKWAELCGTSDDLNLMQQLGVIPSMEEIQKKRQDEKTVEENKAVVRRFGELVNQKDIKGIRELLAPEFVAHRATGDMSRDD